MLRSPTLNQLPPTYPQLPLPNSKARNNSSPKPNPIPKDHKPNLNRYGISNVQYAPEIKYTITSLTI